MTTGCSARGSGPSWATTWKWWARRTTWRPRSTVISECLPDVVLLDVHLPGGGGQAVVTALRSTQPQVRFLALSASDAPEDVIAVIRAGRAGLRDEDDFRAGPGGRGPPGRRRGRGVLPRLAGFVLDAFAALPGDGPGVRPSTRNWIS